MFIGLLNVYKRLLCLLGALVQLINIYVCIRSQISKEFPDNFFLIEMLLVDEVHYIKRQFR